MRVDVVLDGPGHLRIVTRDVPEVGSREALVKVSWAGICGSDVDLRNGARPPRFVRYPVVPGHEWSGVVEVIGDGVDRGLLHTPVVGENIRSCGECVSCREGNVVICERMYSEAGFTIDGAWSDRILLPVALLHRLPVDADLRSAAGIEPAACAATLVARAGIEPQHLVGVVGGGTIGLLCAQLIHSRGADVTVVDPRGWKAPLAIQCGASRLISPESAEQRFGSLDVVIEAAGVLGSVQMAINLVRRGGRVVIGGIASSDDVVHPVDVVSKNLDVAGVFGATSAGWGDAVAEFVAGRLDPGLLVTHEFRLDQIEEALNVVESAGSMVGKVLIRP